MHPQKFCLTFGGISIYIPIAEKDNNGVYHYKIAVTVGNYQKPKLKMVLEFQSEEKLFDWLNERGK